MAMNPDGRYIVTGAGDETLRFWDLGYKNPYNTINKNFDKTLFFGSGLR